MSESPFQHCAEEGCRIGLVHPDQYGPYCAEHLWQRYQAAVAKDSDIPDPRNALCVERWPECFEGGYDPRCCRFPKTCSCTVVHTQPSDTEEGS